MTFYSITRCSINVDGTWLWFSAVHGNVECSDHCDKDPSSDILTVDKDGDLVVSRRRNKTSKFSWNRLFCILWFISYLCYWHSDFSIPYWYFSYAVKFPRFPSSIDVQCCEIILLFLSCLQLFLTWKYISCNLIKKLYTHSMWNYNFPFIFILLHFWIVSLKPYPVRHIRLLQ